MATYIKKIKTPKEETEALTFIIPKNVFYSLNAIARQNNKTRSALARQFLIEKIEDYEDLKTGLKALAEHQKDPNKTYSTEEMMEKLGIRE
jgi:predicted DNA-binding protein